MLYPLSYEGGDGAKCGAKFADTSASPLVRLVEHAHRRNNARRISRSCLWPLICLRKRVQGVNEPMLLSIYRGVRRRFAVWLVRVVPIAQGTHSRLPQYGSSKPSMPPPFGTSDTHGCPSRVALAQHCLLAYSGVVICSRHATHFSPEMSLTAMSKRE